MQLHKFLSLLAVIIGLVGAIFLAKGILVLSPKDMVHSTTHYSAMGWPSKRIISSMAIQKADTLIGFIFIFLAFPIQVISLIVTDKIALGETRSRSIALAFVFVFVLTIILYLLNRGIRDYNEIEMEKLVARDYCTRRFVGRPVDPANAKGLEDMSYEYFNLKRKDAETQIDLIKRIAKHVGWDVPEDIDFSRIAPDNRKK